MTGDEYATALVIPPTSTRSLQWWTDRAVANLRNVVAMDGRRLHGRPRFTVRHGTPAVVMAACATRPEAGGRSR